MVTRGPNRAYFIVVGNDFAWSTLDEGQKRAILLFDDLREYVNDILAFEVLN